MWSQTTKNLAEFITHMRALLGAPIEYVEMDHEQRSLYFLKLAAEKMGEDKSRTNDENTKKIAGVILC